MINGNNFLHTNSHPWPMYIPLRVYRQAGKKGKTVKDAHIMSIITIAQQHGPVQLCRYDEPFQAGTTTFFRMFDPKPLGLYYQQLKRLSTFSLTLLEDGFIFYIHTLSP